MSEPYDPFALVEEADYDDINENEEELEEEGGSSKTLSESTADPSSAFNDINEVGDKRKRDSDIAIEEETRARKKTDSKANRRVPNTEEEKWLWKTGFSLVRQHLKTYRDKKVIDSKNRFEEICKKLSQKVFEKEVEKGTRELTQQKDSKRIQKYVDGYFVMYAQYYNSS